ncbi:MAG: hypothetical protein ACRYGL_10595 [Janthinobacterium lividum]
MTGEDETESNDARQRRKAGDSRRGRRISAIVPDAAAPDAAAPDAAAPGTMAATQNIIARQAIKALFHSRP